MKIFGYQSDSDELLSLEEISFQCNIQELKQVIGFFRHVSEIMEEAGDKFGHEHFSDWIEGCAKGQVDGLDIIISK